jgi:hypothetical protein
VCFLATGCTSGVGCNGNEDAERTFEISRGVAVGWIELLAPFFMRAQFIREYVFSGGAAVY